MGVCFLHLTSWWNPLVWKNMRFCQVAHSLSLSHLSFHLIKIYIYVKLLVHWMCQWSEYTSIIYKYPLTLYIYINNFIWFFFKKNHIRNKKHHVRGGSIPYYGCMLPPSHKLIGPPNIYIYIYIYIYKQKPHVGEHEVLPSGTFIEPLI